MSEYDKLVERLLSEKPELTKEVIEEQVRLKKEKIGAGYLTDQGALFLIASDHGVSLSEPLKVEMDLKDIYAGAKEISLKARILNMSQPKQFSRKDGSPFLLRTMTVYDASSAVSVKLWNEKAKLPGLENLKPGDLVKIIKAYVKADMNGTPTVNVGSGSSIEPTDDESDIPGIDARTMDVGNVSVSETGKDNRNLIVSGVIDGDVGCMQFTNSRGNPGTAVKTRIRGSNGTTVRAVIWGKDETEIPPIISEGARIRLLGVSVKSGNQGNEIHGNEATVIQIDGSHESTPIIGRIISVNAEDGRRFVQCVDGKKNLFQITDIADATGAFAENDIIECMPSKAHGQRITLDSNSFARKLDQDGSIPGLADIRTRINEVKPGSNYCIEAIILKSPERRDVQTKSGESIALSEMFVEDETGQIWVKGWRKQSRLMDGLQAGEVFSMIGLSARDGLEGRTELVLSSFSAIAKKN